MQQSAHTAGCDVQVDFLCRIQAPLLIFAQKSPLTNLLTWALATQPPRFASFPWHPHTKVLDVHFRLRFGSRFTVYVSLTRKSGKARKLVPGHLTVASFTQDSAYGSQISVFTTPEYHTIPQDSEQIALF
jgi:hypothetical protein